jgi:hypothetical protein
LQEIFGLVAQQTLPVTHLADDDLWCLLIRIGWGGHELFSLR